MAFAVPFTIGEEVTHNKLRETFEVGNMGGMRRSKKNNALVLICDHTKGLYDDQWFGDVLHYTGEGKTGDQKLERQNKTLFESNTNGVDIYLFEVLVPKKYIYQGRVVLADTPYQSNQYDVNGNERKVWIFPIQSTSSFAVVEREEVQKNVKSKTEAIVQMAFDDLKRKAIERQSSTVPYRRTASTTYIRDPYIARYARLRANGKCQLCGQSAPFIDNNGDPYLESHHIIWLSRGGADTIENTVGLCPNCHRRMHVLDQDEDRKRLITTNRSSKKVKVKRIMH